MSLAQQHAQFRDPASQQFWQEIERGEEEVIAEYLKKIENTPSALERNFLRALCGMFFMFLGIMALAAFSGPVSTYLDSAPPKTTPIAQSSYIVVTGSYLVRAGGTENTSSRAGPREFPDPVLVKLHE